MKIRDAKDIARSLYELGQSGKELSVLIKETSQGVRASKKLWREGNRSKLVNIGMAIFMFRNQRL
jgi:hypothetical protein